MYPKKIKIILYLPLALLFIANFFILPCMVPPAQADSSMPTLQVPIPNLTFTAPTDCGTDSSGNKLSCVAWIGEYIAGVYKYAIGIVGILAAVVLMIGGVIWIVAGGSATMIGEAKSWIGASLTGLVIALCSYLILYTINPALTVFNPLQIAQVKKVETAISGACTWTPDTISMNGGVGDTICGGDTNKTITTDTSKCGTQTTADSGNVVYHCCCANTGTIEAGNISGCNILVYNQPLRNTRTTNNGVTTCYYDCSSYVNAYLSQQGLSSVGNTTTDMLNNSQAVNYTSGMSLDENDVIVYPGHVVICVDATCSHVNNMSGEEFGLKTNQGSSYFLGQSGVKIIKR